MPSGLQTRVIALCFVRLQDPPASLFLLPRRGVRNDRAFHRARGATWVTTWHHVPFGHMTPCAEAHGGVAVYTATASDAARTPAFRTRMDFAACCMSQAASLAPTLSRSCELSPGHALGPSARVAGVCPFIRFQDR